MKSIMNNLEEKNIFFKNLHLFSFLSTQEIKCLCSMFYEVKFYKDQFLFLEGDNPTGLMFIVYGYVKIIKQALSGKNVIIKLACPKDILGEVALFQEVSYPATAQALVETKCYKINKSDMVHVVRKHPDVVAKLMDMGLKRLRETYFIIEKYGNMSLEKRVAVTLLRLIEQVGEREGVIFKLIIPIGRQDLADMVGSTRESVSRIMANLKRKNIIKYSNRKIHIHDIDQLTLIAEDE